MEWINALTKEELLARARQAQATIFEEQEVLKMIIERLDREVKDGK